MSFLRLFDINTDVHEAFLAFKYMLRGWRLFDITVIYEELSLPMDDFIVAVSAIVILFIFGLIQRRGSVRERIFALPVPIQWCVLSILVTIVSVFGYYGPGYDAASFIYGAF